MCVCVCGGSGVYAKGIRMVGVVVVCVFGGGGVYVGGRIAVILIINKALILHSPLRLLMDYPFVRQTSESYVQHIRSLSARDSQRQISANTVRILLLEEQNSELRERGLREARERGGSSAQGQVWSGYHL